MLQFIRILLLWVTLLFAGHSVLAHYLLGGVAARTLVAGIEPNALKFYGFLAAFGIAAYYFCREIEDWRKPMPLKVVVSAALAIAFLGGLSGLERLDSRMYAEMSDYQRELVAGRFDTSPGNLASTFQKAVTQGASRGEAVRAYPQALAGGLTLRRDGTAYENFLYWTGPMGDPVGAQVAYTKEPHRVEQVVALPLARRPLSGPPENSPSESSTADPADAEEGREGDDETP